MTSKTTKFQLVSHPSFRNMYKCNKRTKLALASVAQSVGESSCTQKDGRFDSWSGYIPRLWARSPVGGHAGANSQIFLSLSIESVLKKRKTRTKMSSMNRVPNYKKLGEKLVYINSRTLFPWPPGKRVIFWNRVHPFLRIFVDTF